MIEGVGGRSFPIQPPQELPGLAGSEGAAGARGLSTAGGAGEAQSFGSAMKQFLGEVNDLQSRAGEEMQAFVRGEAVDLHQVALAQQEAGIAVRLVSEMRDRLLQAYQEIMRTGV